MWEVAYKGLDHSSNKDSIVFCPTWRCQGATLGPSWVQVLSLSYEFPASYSARLADLPAPMPLIAVALKMACMGFTGLQQKKTLPLTEQHKSNLQYQKGLVTAVQEVTSFQDSQSHWAPTQFSLAFGSHQTKKKVKNRQMQRVAPVSLSKVEKQQETKAWMGTRQDNGAPWTFHNHTSV